MDDIPLDFVLVRGPESVTRRLHVKVPADGTPVTLGRALHCGAVLDPWLVFASQVQCSVFCVPDGDGGSAAITPTVQSPQKGSENVVEEPAPAEPTEKSAAVKSKPPRPDKQDSGEATPTPKRRPLQGVQSGGSSGGASAAAETPKPSRNPRLFLTDMCSSNGTFVNGVRVSSTDAVELADGDAVIFGGMRDVEVGAALPTDAFTGPELVVWRVVLVGGGSKINQPTEFPYEATPALLPTAEALLREEHEVLSTALRSLHRAPPQTPLVTTPSSGDGATPASPAIPQQLFSAQTPPTELRRPPSDAEVPVTEMPAGAEASELAAAGETAITDPESSEQRRSGTVAARFSGQPVSASAADRTAPTAPTASVVVAEVAVGAEESDDVDASSREPRAEPEPPSSDTDFFLLLNTLESPSNAPAVKEPPSPVHFHAVRVGRHTYHVPISSLLGASLAEVADAALELGAESKGPGGDEVQSTETGRKRGRAASKKQHRTEVPQASAQDQLRRLPTPIHAIHFTDSHWKWVMDNPNSAARASPLPTGLSSCVFHAMLPVPSIQSILVCRERLGVSVELKDGCYVPMIQPGVLDGAPENRWLVWMLEDCQLAPPHRSEEAAEPQVPAGKRRAVGKRRKSVASSNAVAALNPADPSSAHTVSLHETFDEWIAHMTAFYSAFRVPAPIPVDPDTFDKLFAPEMIME